MAPYPTAGVDQDEDDSYRIKVSFSYISAKISDADMMVLRKWRERCPELRERWDENTPVTAWKGVIFGEAGGVDAGRVAGPHADTAHHIIQPRCDHPFLEVTATAISLTTLS
jgi:hypothetical protein